MNLNNDFVTWASIISITSAIIALWLGMRSIMKTQRALGIAITYLLKKDQENEDKG